MKHVFEFTGKHPQISFSGTAYESGREAPTWRGARVDGLIVDCTQREEGLKEGDALYIEGDLETIRKICTDILDQLKWIEEEERAVIEERRPFFVQCTVCETWYHSEHPDHGDGRGMTCLRDGTVMLGNRLITIYGPDTTAINLEVRHLKKGDRFAVREPTMDYERRMFVALEDPITFRGSYQVRIKRDP